jgi:hypothetical protein
VEDRLRSHLRRVGPRGDGYDPGQVMSETEAEAIGIVRAVRASGLPVVISFTLETDGRLSTGQSQKLSTPSTQRLTK